MLNQKERYEDFQKINPFDWKDEFKQIFEGGVLM